VPASRETRSDAIAPRKVCRKQPCEGEDLSVSRQQVAAGGEIFQEKITRERKNTITGRGKSFTRHSTRAVFHGNMVHWTTGSFA
jgi:hypothetical protein